ncbi:MAG: LysM peptidoglycan-binding domain-containing protein [Flavobacteriia bacterium]|jgi:hypothetical protein|nr:LysM peptidoglycan-binding domain-containing protein [Flavobacteriia bacterium]NDA06491.1 LysM peptidoglycan-binding domain-containing protein [Flavobacteriia bacterium]NDA28178.1 LysM peptidoglycan-binding domain-containing protein [Flavobacteriia bacterium]NDD19279.1 LysM peptidoglycan-binding domain-containing protein [Flavobacteriia bacterium]
MRRYGWILLGIMGCMAQAAQPIYYFPSLIRGSQLLWQHEQAGSPNAAVHFVGPFGLHPVAVAKFGYPMEAYQDSALAFHLAEHLWLEYYCALGDSSQADLALVMGPAFVRQQGVEEVSGAIRALEGAKKDPQAGLHARFVASSSTSTASATPSQGPHLGAIPRYEHYTVQPGDSLWKIHQKFPQHSLASLVEANGGRETIYVGQVLHIPL